jgi:hypothetical protein
MTSDEESVVEAAIRKKRQLDETDEMLELDTIRNTSFKRLVYLIWELRAVDWEAERKGMTVEEYKETSTGDPLEKNTLEIKNDISFGIFVSEEVEISRVETILSGYRGGRPTRRTAYDYLSTVQALAFAMEQY